MKWAIAIMLAAALVAGCKDKEKNPVLKYGETLIKSINTSKSTAAAINIDGARTAIRSYHTMNGRYPASIDEVKEIMGYKFRPEQYNYDPTTGEITAK